jgi:hypothetical protein
MLISSNDLALFTAKTSRKPSPVLMYWSLMALQNEHIYNVQVARFRLAYSGL